MTFLSASVVEHLGSVSVVTSEWRWIPLTDRVRDHVSDRCVRNAGKAGKMDLAGETGRNVQHPVRKLPQKPFSGERSAQHG